MKQELFNKINTFVQSNNYTEETEENIAAAALAKLQCILSAEGELGNNSRKAAIRAVSQFLEGGELQRKKLLCFCEEFYDPTAARKNRGASAACLSDDELAMLNKFVRRHKSDKTFGDAVYTIMDKHGMTAPQVYKNALMRRQDFARVTDTKCENVTRKMVWQIVIGLHCTLVEADELLFSAGYIRRNNKFDLTLQYCVEHGIYDIEAIDAVLSEYNLKTFAC
ncbi:MAG: hypothetical protein ACI4MQ_01915 [Candidatus Coproplasma sp.]